nr:MAG TPA: hypothetical protein [Caudoviricetes sp.]
MVYITYYQNEILLIRYYSYRRYIIVFFLY